MKDIPIIDVIYFILLFGCFAVCLFRSKNLYEIRHVIILLGILILIQLYAEYLNIVVNKNNLYLYHILTPIEYFILASIFASNIISKVVRKFLQYSKFIFPIVAFIFFKIEGATANNSYSSALEELILTFCSLISLRELMVFSVDVHINRSSFFWFSTAVLFYSIGNLLVSGLLNYLIIENVNIARIIYRSTYIFSYQFFILLIIASFMPQKKEQ
jgi:hypothetical protein